MNKGICYIVCASEDIGDFHIDKKSEDYIISADGGFNYLHGMGVKADMALGDFDSLGRVPDHENVIIHKVEKDYSDSALAVDEGFIRNYSRFVIYGGFGGRRFDHTVANIQLLNRIAVRGGRGYLIGSNVLMTVIRNTEIIFDGCESGIFSVFSLGESASNVTISGAKYPLERYTMLNTNPIGVSNEFTGGRCTVSVGNGSLLIMWKGGHFIW